VLRRADDSEIDIPDAPTVVWGRHRTQEAINDGDECQRLPMVFFERPRCPYCQNASLHNRGSQASDDGSTKRYTTCKACQKKFVVIIE
jgi:transposase-like protein